MGFELLIVAAVVIVAIGMYNSLVKLRERADGAWADVDVQLKRRYDLIPNLVETVKGYASHEQETLEKVVQARNAAMTAQGPGAKGEAEGMLTGALKSLFALAEAYPDLKAAGGFRDLQGSLAEIEDAIANQRRYYNAVIRDFNTKTQTFPGVLIARAFGFQQREFFEAEEDEKEAPKVSFD
jgi:LemA protein